VPLLLVAALTACGGSPSLSGADQAAAAASDVPTPGGVPTPSPAATSRATPAPEPAPPEEGPADQPVGAPEEPATAEPPNAVPPNAVPPTAEPPTPEPPTVEPAVGSGAPDLDGDGRGDRVTLTAVPDLGWSFDVRLADGRETSAPLPDDQVVREDVEVLGAVDLDGDGVDEVLVRTVRAVGGENAVVFRLDGDGVWLVRTDEGAPWELSTSGGMTGPRSYECAGGEVRTRESERQADGTYRATTWRWTLDGHVARPLGGARDDALSAEEVSLDPSTCRS
jgi:hypothetical protein